KQAAYRQSDGDVAGADGGQAEGDPAEPLAARPQPQQRTADEAEQEPDQRLVEVVALEVADLALDLRALATLGRHAAHLAHPGAERRAELLRFACRVDDPIERCERLEMSLRRSIVGPP